ncbi:hypothetical protein [Streptomyces sp. B6B3]|uniref:hypothetical protein n=1 Tax=Streptomyces sp. B6B3 TaxID=3153570 RepID=UPI00325D8B19
MSPRSAQGFRPPPRGDDATRFTTGSGAHDFQQIARMYGDIHNHSHAGAPPEELYRQGLDLLHREQPEAAHQLISDAVSRGHVSAESLYYLMLSLVRRRAVDELTGSELRQIREIGRRIRAYPDDAYREAGGAILALLRGAFGLVPEQPDETATRGARSPLNAELVLKDLPAPRRDEITNHLRGIISGAEQDRLDHEEEQEIREKRMSDDREERVPLFFMHDPEPPEPLRPAPPRFGLAGPAWFALAAVACVAGLVSLARLAVLGDVAAAVPGLLLVVAGAGAALRYGLDAAWRLWRLAEEEDRRTRSVPATRRAGAARLYAGGLLPPAQTQAFHDEIYAIVRGRFDEQLEAHEDLATWRQESEIVRQNLAAELTDLYARQDRRTDAWTLDWLVQHHAAATAGAWRRGALRTSDAALRTPFTGWAAFAGGAVALLAGVALTLAAAAGESAGLAFGSVLLLCAGGYFGVRRGFGLYAERRRFAADSEEFARRHEEELRVYEWWRDYLASRRPTDSEMARWLDYDLRHLRRRAILHYDLRNSDIEAAFFVLEAAPGCLRARVRGRPQRYSDYVVRLFLLTSGGFRLRVWSLDFFTARDEGRSRQSFRYDVIGTAHLDEESVPERLRITLTNRQQIDVRVECYGRSRGGEARRLPDDLDAEQLRELALTSSGISRARDILEGVAAEGRAWFDQQRARNRERFREVLDGPGGFTDDLPDDTSHDLPDDIGSDAEDLGAPGNAGDSGNAEGSGNPGEAGKES